MDSLGSGVLRFTLVALLGFEEETKFRDPLLKGFTKVATSLSKKKKTWILAFCRAKYTMQTEGRFLPMWGGRTKLDIRNQQNR